MPAEWERSTYGLHFMHIGMPMIKKIMQFGDISIVRLNLSTLSYLV